MANLTIMSEKQEEIFNEVDQMKIHNMLELFDDVELSKEQRAELLRRMSTIRYNAVTGNSGTSVRNFGVFKGKKFLGVQNCNEVELAITQVTKIGGSFERDAFRFFAEKINYNINGYHEIVQHIKEICEHLPRVNARQLIPVRLVATKLALKYDTDYYDVFLNCHLELISELDQFNYYCNQLKTK